MKKIKLISLIISISLLTSLVACSAPKEGAQQQTQIPTEQMETEAQTHTEEKSENMTETSTEKQSESIIEPEIEEMAQVEDFISLCDYRYNVKETHDFKSGKEYSVYFELPENATMLSFYFGSLQDTNSNIHVSIHKTEKLPPSASTLPESALGELVYSEIITSIPFNTYQVYFNEGEISSGSYIISITSPAGETEYNDFILLGKGWSQNLPNGYEDYNIQTFVNGASQRYGIYGGFVVKHDVPKSSVGELNEEIVTERIEGEKVAKVIILSGQSNAAGATPYSHLQRHVTPEKYQEYLNGYDNVKIIYSSAALNNGEIVIKNQSDEFVSTKLGQGYVSSYLGPEVGLAEYLSKTYPDETFYIIKYGVGSASLSGYFNPTSPSTSAAYKALIEKIDLGLYILEKEGYTPKIVAFLWMQGESDANNLYNTYGYYNLQKTMVEHIREAYSSYAPARGIAFIDAAIANHGTWATHMLINSLKKKYSYESRANYYVDTVKAGLVTLTEDENTDQYHYVSTSVITLGKLFGEKISEHID